MELFIVFHVLNVIKQVFRNFILRFFFLKIHSEFLAKYLSAYKINALSYHAGLSDSKRQLVQNQWANDDCQVMKNFYLKKKFILFFSARLFVQPLLLEWVLINLMFVLLFIFLCQNQLKFVFRNFCFFS